MTCVETQSVELVWTLLDDLIRGTHALPPSALQPFRDLVVQFLGLRLFHVDLVLLQPQEVELVDGPVERIIGDVLERRDTRSGVSIDVSRASSSRRPSVGRPDSTNEEPKNRGSEERVRHHAAKGAVHPVGAAEEGATEGGPRRVLREVSGPRGRNGKRGA